jgi:ABC-type nitrate/sulfonate/bicarbonate transport system ATPase subunit
MKFVSSGQAVTALEDLSFAAAEREFISLVDPSGCGKSTCLGLIAGLHAPSTGKVLLGSDEVSGYSSRVGSVLQKDLLVTAERCVGTESAHPAATAAAANNGRGKC